MASNNLHDDAKRARRTEPDVTVVVGGTEFRHYSHILCFASEYFDGALNSGMKETQNKRIELPEADPEEWKLLMHHLEPCSSAEITFENVETLIRLSSEYQVTGLLDRCANVYQDKVFTKKPSANCSIVDELLQAVAFCSHYNLERTKDLIVSKLSRTVKDRPEWIVQVEGCFDRVWDLLVQDKSRELRDSFFHYLPKNFQNPNRYGSTLTDNVLFPELVKARMVQNVHLKRIRKTFADKLQMLLEQVVELPAAAPFLKPVNRRLLPRYYQVITNPIDLKTIEEKNAQYEYKSVQGFLGEFWLMERNAIEFNGQNHAISEAATQTRRFLEARISLVRNDLTSLENSLALGENL